MATQQPASLDALRHTVLAQALQDVLAGPASPSAPTIDASSAQVLRQTAQVAAALQELQLASGGSKPESGGGEPGGSGGASQAADAAAAAEASSDCDEAAAFTGSTAGPLGVCVADLLAEALPAEGARAAALRAALPALEAELSRRCRLVGAASGYEAEDPGGLADHLLQLTAARDQASQSAAWQAAAAQAQEAAELQARAGEALAGLVRRHKLEGQKAADEAHAAYLRCECGWLKEKVRQVQLQLQQSTYTPDALAALRRVAAEVDRAAGEAGAALQQASLQLQAYRALGPGFEAAAAQHAAVLEAVEEAGYELREVAQFQQLAALTG